MTRREFTTMLQSPLLAQSGHPLRCVVSGMPVGSRDDLLLICRAGIRINMVQLLYGVAGRLLSASKVHPKLQSIPSNWKIRDCSQSMPLSPNNSRLVCPISTYTCLILLCESVDSLPGAKLIKFLHWCLVSHRRGSSRKNMKLIPIPVRLYSPETR